MHLEKGSFKVNAQRLKPYFGGDFHASKQAINLSTLGTVQQRHQSEHIRNSAVRNSSNLGVSGTLRLREVELMTLNKALLRRQPNHSEVFHSLV